MIRMMFVLLAGLFAAMLIWGTDTTNIQSKSITKAVLEEPPKEVVEPDFAESLVDQFVEESQIAEPPLAVSAETKTIPAAGLEANVTDLESINLTGAQATKVLKVFKATDAPPDAAVPVVIPEVGRLLIVTGTSVNMRSGPSTTWEVIGNLRRGAKAELVAQADGGWLQIRDVVTGRVGYMAGRFLEPFQE